MVVIGDDGLARCPWGADPPLYRDYHDLEWGMPVRGDQALYERLTLEAFQSGLAWITILRKRDAFRAAFDDFRIESVADYDERDVKRLMADVGIVRNRAKIEAAIANARVLADWQAAEGPGCLDALVWSHADPQHPVPQALADVPAVTPASTALAKALKARGWRFLGPTTAYAALQAVGVVDDHLAGCHARRAR